MLLNHLYDIHIIIYILYKIYFTPTTNNIFWHLVCYVLIPWNQWLVNGWERKGGPDDDSGSFARIPFRHFLPVSYELTAFLQPTIFLSQVWRWVIGVGGRWRLLQRLPSYSSRPPKRQRRRAAIVARAAATQGQDSSWSKGWCWRGGWTPAPALPSFSSPFSSSPTAGPTWLPGAARRAVGGWTRRVQQQE